MTIALQPMDDRIATFKLRNPGLPTTFVFTPSYVHRYKSTIRLHCSRKWKLWQIWCNNQLTDVITLTENPNRLYKAGI